MVVQIVVRQCKKRLEEGPLVLIEIKSSLEYELEKEASTSSTLLLYTLLSSIPPLLSLLPTPIDFPLIYYNISQYGSFNMKQILLQMRQ